jgi:hypothetical protein
MLLIEYAGQLLSVVAHKVNLQHRFEQLRGIFRKLASVQI